MTDSSTSTTIVTIDGPAGSGKSTAARALAQRLGFEFLDTGAMYRAVAWKCRELQLPPQEEERVSEMTRNMKIEFRDSRLLVDGQDITGEIRTSEVSHIASIIAQYPAVRTALVELQRECGSQSNTVTEGRDQGTVVFPSASHKFFLTARPEVRAQRRFDEMADDSNRPEFEALVQEIRERDERDANREIAPLKPAEDAETIDTSDSVLEEVVDLLVSRVTQNPES